jgi:DNA-binding response OmpR family regulator
MLLAGKSVLIVEDEFLLGELLEDMARDLGCAAFLRAANVPGALKIIETSDFDAAIIDMNLDGTSSKPIAEALLSKGVPFIISTGYDPVSIGQGWANIPVLQKPFQAAQLEAAVQSALGRYLAR